MPRVDGRQRGRGVVRGAVAVAVGIGLGPLALGPLGAAMAATGPGGVPTADSPIADKQAEAAQIAQTLQQEAVHLEELAERLNGARVHAEQVKRELAGTQDDLSTTSQQLDATRQVLRRQAVEAYINGGRSLMVPLKGAGGADALLRRQAYATAVASVESDAIRELHTLTRRLVDTQTKLSIEHQAAEAAVVQISRDEQATAGAAAAQQATLTAIQGDLATLVHQQQAQSAAAEEARLQAQFAPKPAASTGTNRVAVAPRATAATTARTSVAAIAAVASATGGTLARSNPATRAFVATPATSGAPAHRPLVGPLPAPAPPTTHPAPRPTTGPSPPSVPIAPPHPAGNAPAPGWQIALAYARAQIGKPYQWGGAGPDTFDCSGLTMRAWGAAGVMLDHYAPDQYAATRRIAIPDLQPGDLVFYGSPTNVYHVGIYVGGGVMIQAPATGQLVQYSTIYFTGLFAGGRVY